MFAPNSKLSRIGNPVGKQLFCSPQALPVFKNLLKLALGGNHWAKLIVGGITDLSSGKSHRDNIFIKQKTSLAYGKGAFYVVLPGVTASLEEHPNGSYILQHIKADTNYQALQKTSAKPGLWRISEAEGIKPELQKDGRILNKEYRPVVIADMANAPITDVASSTRKGLIESDGTIKRMVKDNGFDMHYTPGEQWSGIIGLKSAKRALATPKDTSITRSATLLAHTMYQARNIKGVLWYSDWGGSAVLTRAMEILHHEKNISLKGHAIFMNRPTTKANYAIQLAKKLDLTPDAKGMKTGLHPKELIGNIFVSDIQMTKKTMGRALTSTGFGVSAAGAAFAIGGASITTSGIIGIAGAMFFVGKAVKSGAVNFKGREHK